MLYSNSYMDPRILDERVGEDMDPWDGRLLMLFSRFGSWLQFLVPAAGRAATVLTR